MFLYSKYLELKKGFKYPSKMTHTYFFHLNKHEVPYFLESKTHLIISRTQNIDNHLIKNTHINCTEV